MECGHELSDDKKEDPQDFVTYTVELIDGREMDFTREIFEPIGNFYQWLLKDVLSPIFPEKKCE